MYSFDSRVRYSECDAQGRLTLVSLVNYLQDCSIFHSESLGHGVAYMREHGIAWFISAWQIEVARLPRLYEDIVIGTWCYEVGRTQAGRNFTIATAEGEALVRADSLWFVYDIVARHPVRIPESEMLYVSGDPQLDMPKTMRKLPVEGACEQGAAIAVTSQHLDTNGHVNNAQYVAMAADAAAAAQGIGDVGAIQRICVQYRQMALLGDVIVPGVHAGAGGLTVNLAAPDGSTYAVVRLEGAGA